MADGSDRIEAELAGLLAVLKADRRNVRALLRIAGLYAARGDLATAAASYRTALQEIPAGAPVPPDLQPMIETARAVIAANDAAMEGFLEQRFEALRAKHAGQSLARFDKSLATLLHKRRVYRPQPSFMYVPELPAIEFFDRAAFPWLDALEAATQDITAELMAVMADGPSVVEPYMDLPGEVNALWRELNHSRRWSAFFFWREGKPYTDNLARCPKTAAALEAWPPCDLPGCAPTAMFSILEPRTRIPPHVGFNNARLVTHLPLVIPPGCGFRVGGETRKWEVGKAFVFDDTIEHEAWNDSDEPRAVLIVDVWNPYLSVAEREMICALTVGVNDYYGALPDFIRPLQKAE